MSRLFGSSGSTSGEREVAENEDRSGLADDDRAGESATRSDGDNGAPDLAEEEPGLGAGGMRSREEAESSIAGRVDQVGSRPSGDVSPSAGTGVASQKGGQRSVGGRSQGGGSLSSSEHSGEIQNAQSDDAEETGYVGDGRYRRASGEERVRITPYVRPDQARALKVAAATGDDPRGSDMSEIMQALLDEAGYSS